MVAEMERKSAGQGENVEGREPRSVKEAEGSVGKEGRRAEETSFAISIFPSWCKDCGICAEFCRKKVFDRDVMGAPVVSRPEDCTGCQDCVLHCPDFAIQVQARKKEKG